METPSATFIKGYELQERIGAGGFGAVYRAYQSSVGREVAIKIILPRFANQPEFIRRFENEAQLIARLEHLHIIPLYDYWRDPEGAYLVMRYLRGGSLRDALQDGPFDVQTTAQLLDQIASALALAHRHSIVHRDLKPANILLDEDGNAYVADFGIAKDLVNLQSGSTQADAVVGSPDYLAPEQARSEPVTAQTDIYSLGVTLYEVLTGKHPFLSVTPLERMYKHLNEPLPLVDNLPAAIVDVVNAVIQKATAKNPAHRYPDVIAFAAAFHEAMGLNRVQAAENLVETLTPREQEVLQRIIDGRSNREIAQELFVTIPTVKWYIKQIYGKLRVRSRVQAIVRARELNLITKGSDSAAVTSAVVVPTDEFAPENPYKGLRPFQAADCTDFFGREAITDRLVKRLGETGTSPRFVAVIGPSGSGKSSLVKAGLIPALWRGAIPGSERWFVVEMLPGAHPLDELEVALTRLAASRSGNLREQLERDERGLVRAAQLILPNDGSELILVIDQFEEVFTLVDSEETRVHFLDMLHEAVTDPRSRVRVVITLRADFYDRPLLYSAFGELVRSRMETVLPLAADGLERAIARPAERVGVSFEPGLVASIVSEINYQPGALPLLQYALTELFDRRQGRLLVRDAYQAIGGTVGALARRADEIYEGLDDKGQEAARQMFLRLVTLGEGVEDTRRRVPRSELLAIAADADTMDDLIDTYTEYRLLSLDHDPATRSPTVEVAHEAILREWKRLHGWLNESRHDIRMQRLLSAAALEWLNASRDESFLLRGGRLDQFQAWATDTKLAFTQKERDYLDASLAERERQTIAEQQRQARELGLAQESARLATQAATAARQAEAAQRQAANRLRYLVTALGLFLLVTVGLSLWALNSQANAVAEAQSRATQQSIAQANALEAQSFALASAAQTELIKGNGEIALALAVAANRTANPPRFAQSVLYDVAYTPGSRRLLLGHSGEVYHTSFSPDQHTAVSAGADSIIILWDLATGQPVRQFRGHTGPISSVAFSQDGRSLLSSSEDGSLILWDVDTGHLIRRFEAYTTPVYNAVFSPDERYAIAGSEGKLVLLWAVDTGRLIRRFAGHEDLVGQVFFLENGAKAISLSVDKTLIVWDVATGELLRRIEIEASETMDVSKDGKTIFCLSNTGALVEIDLETGKELRRANLVGAGGSFILSPDGKRALIGASNGTIILLDVATFKEIRRLSGHTRAVNGLAFSPDGHQAITGSSDGTVRIWNLDNLAQVQRFKGHTSLVSNIAVSRDGLRLLSGSRDTTAILWDTTTAQPLHTFAGHTKSVTYVAFSPDEKTALTASVDLTLILWDVESGQELRRFVGHTNGLRGIAFSPDGKQIVSTSLDGTARFWDLSSGKEIRQFVPGGDYLSNPILSQDGHRLLVGTTSGFTTGTTHDIYVVMWDLATGQEMRRFSGHTNLIQALALSPDGRTFLSAGADATVRLWDIATGRELSRFTGHDRLVSKVVFSPGGQMALSQDNVSNLLLWDVASGQILRRFEGFANAAAFAPGGQSVFIGNATNIEQWHLSLSLNDLLRWIYDNRFVRELTCSERAHYHVEPLCNEQDQFPTRTPFAVGTRDAHMG